jgi:hypothetical protein
LNIHDDGGFAQFFRQTLVLPAELLHFFFLRIPLGLGTAFVRGQALENAGLPLATPNDEVRGVKAFTALQGADGTRLSGGNIGLSQNPQFVLSGEGATLGIGDHLRVWPQRAGWLGRAGEAEDVPLFFTLIPVLALLSNYDRENCLINVGTEDRLQIVNSTFTERST